MKGIQRSVELFRAFQHEGTDPATFYGLLADDTVADVSRFCRLDGTVVLDVGGASGYVAEAFRQRGARALTAEYDVDQTTEHGRHLVDGIIADGCALPLADGSVDITYTSNVLEHVRHYERMLSEMVRVTAPGGVLYITFTNWLSPWGGHETSPWHYFGGEWAAQRYERRTGQPAKNRYGTSLFRLSVRDVLHWSTTCPDADLLDAFPRYYPRWTKGLVKIPGVRELATWNLVVVLRRRPSRSE